MKEKHFSLSWDAVQGTGANTSLRSAGLRVCENGGTLSRDAQDPRGSGTHPAEEGGADSARPMLTAAPSRGRSKAGRQVRQLRSANPAPQPREDGRSPAPSRGGEG